MTAEITSKKMMNSETVDEIPIEREGLMLRDDVVAKRRNQQPFPEVSVNDGTNIGIGKPLL